MTTQEIHIDATSVAIGDIMRAGYEFRTPEDGQFYPHFRVPDGHVAVVIWRQPEVCRKTPYVRGTIMYGRPKNLIHALRVSGYGWRGMERDIEDAR